MINALQNNTPPHDDIKHMNTPPNINEPLTQLRTLIVSVEADMSLGCLSTTPTQSITDRLILINHLIEDIKHVYDYDATFMITHSPYLTIAKRKHNL